MRNLRVGDKVVLGGSGFHGTLRDTVTLVSELYGEDVYYENGQMGYQPSSRCYESFKVRLVSEIEDSSDTENPTIVEESNNPQHYGGDWRTDDFIAEMELPFREGNIVKYVVRHKKKNGLEDLKKARNYLNRLIEKWDD